MFAHTNIYSLNLYIFPAKSCTVVVSAFAPKRHVMGWNQSQGGSTRSLILGPPNPDGYLASSTWDVKGGLGIASHITPLVYCTAKVFVV